MNIKFSLQFLRRKIYKDISFENNQLGKKAYFWSFFFNKAESKFQLSHWCIAQYSYGGRGVHPVYKEIILKLRPNLEREDSKQRVNPECGRGQAFYRAFVSRYIWMAPI